MQLGVSSSLLDVVHLLADINRLGKIQQRSLQIWLASFALSATADVLNLLSLVADLDDRAAVLLFVLPLYHKSTLMCV